MKIDCAGAHVGPRTVPTFSAPDGHGLLRMLERAGNASVRRWRERRAALAPPRQPTR